EPQLLQGHSWSTMRGGDRVPGERDPRSVRGDHRLFEARIRIVSNHAAVARRQFDSHQHGPLSGTGTADSPGCDEEAAVRADIESGFEQRGARARCQVTGSGYVEQTNFVR